jgi:hypothetical protein
MGNEYQIEILFNQMSRNFEIKENFFWERVRSL